MLFGIILVGGVVSSHFVGLADSKTYTDTKIDMVEKDIVTMKMSVTKIEQILVERYGEPHGSKNRKSRNTP